MSIQKSGHQSKNVTDELIDNDSNSISIRELVLVVWSGKFIVLFSMICALIISVGIALNTPNVYQSEVLLAPVAGDSSSFGALQGQLGGLASLAGVSIPSGESDKTIMGIELLKSRVFFTEFMENHNILVPLMAAKGWDSVENVLIFDEEIYDKQTNSWIREVKPPLKSKPSIQEAHVEFLKRLAINQDKETGFVTISIKYFSPYIAQKWVEHLVDDINERIRRDDILQAEKSVDFLTRQIELTKIAELKAGLYDLIQTQMETIMLANANSEYLFKTIDPAIVPELKAGPKRALICVVGVIVGFTLGVLLVIAWAFIFSDRSRRKNIISN